MADKKGIAKKETIHSYFYVFADAASTKNLSKRTELSNTENSELRIPLDSIVLAAFKRFSEEFNDQARVYSTMERTIFDKIRRALGIQDLPAFGIANEDLTKKEHLSQKPQSPLPNPLNFLKRKERQAILQSGVFIPIADRRVLSLFTSSDDLYNFVRDLHLKNIDDGPSGVTKKIDEKIRELGGRRLIKIVAVGRKVFLG